MYVPFNIVKELWEKEIELKKAGIELDATDTHIAQIFGIDENKTITVNLLLTDEYLKKLESQRVENISMYYNKTLAKFLRRYYPQKYPQPEVLPLYKIELIFSQYQLANKLSSFEDRVFKKRELKLLQDIISFSGRTKKIIIPYGTPISDSIMEKIKAYTSERTELEYTTNEKGVLLVFDNEAYRNAPPLLRLQFMIRKIFTDVNYKNLKVIDVDSGFREYFEPAGSFYSKLVLLVGKTPKNVFLYKKIKVFDPFAKMVWLKRDNLNTNPDLLFDSITNKLSQDYTTEYNTFIKERDKKKPLSHIELQKYRKLLTNFSKKFSIKAYIEIAYDILEKGMQYDMFQPYTHLLNVLLDLRQPPTRIFERLLIE